MRAAAERAGDLVVLYGSATGRDGIGGARVLASRDVRRTTTRPSARRVQVGDPFAEKLLIEATLELIHGGLVESVQDLGAAGITCATSETADRGGMGMALDLDAIPRREPGIEPFEVLISESQERMLAIVRAGALGRCARRVRPLGPAGRDHRPCHRRRRTSLVASRRRGARARSPRAPSRARPIVFAREVARARPPAHGSRPGRARGARRHAPGARAWIPGAVLLGLLGSPNLGSRAVVYEQYDHNVQANTVAGPGRGAAVIRIKGTTKALVATTDGDAPVGALDPWLGAAHVRRRGGPQRLDHGRDAAGRHRTASTSATRRGPRRSGSSRRRSAASATPAVPSTSRSPAATSRSTTRRPARPSRPRPRSASSGCWRTSRSSVVPRSPPTATRSLLVGDDRARARRVRVRAHRGHRRGGPSAGDRSGTGSRRPAVHPRGDRPRARRGGPGHLGWRPRRRARGDGDLGRPRAHRSGYRWATRLRSSCSAKVPRGSSARSSRGTSRHASCSPASTACPARSSARPAGTA